MRRVLILIVFGCGTIGALGTSVLFVAGSGGQFERRLAAQWKLGQVELSGTRMSDLDTVAFETFRIRSDPQVDSRYLLSLRNLEWRRAAWIPREDRLDLDRAGVRFEEGLLNLERRDGVGWNFQGVWPSVSSFGELPAEIAGGEVQVLVRRVGPQGTDELRFAARELDYRVDSQERIFKGKVQGEEWGDGQFTWTSPAPGSAEGASESFRVRIDDLALEELPAAILRRVWGFPWPVGLPVPEGRADLDWNLSPTEDEVVIKHYLATLSPSGWALPLRYLSGTARLDRRRADWTVDQGTFSQSRVRGNLSADFVERTVEGSVALEQVLSDARLGDGLPGPWAPLLRALHLTGNGFIKIEVKGHLDDPWWRCVPSIHLEIEGASLQGDEKSDAVTGSFEITPVGGQSEWRIAGTTQRSDVRRFRIHGGQWEGTASAEALRLRRIDGSHLSLVIEARDPSEGGGVTFEVANEDTSVSDFLHRAWGAGRCSLYVKGHWAPGEELFWEGWMTWHGVDPQTPDSWPLRPPEGAVSGAVLFRRERGLVSVPALLVRDDRGVWVARGEVRRDGTWALTGQARDGAQQLVTLDSVPWILDHAGEAWSPFRGEGPIFEWK